MDKIDVLIPCCNKAQTIGKVCADFKKYLPESTIYVMKRFQASIICGFHAAVSLPSFFSKMIPASAMQKERMGFEFRFALLETVGHGKPEAYDVD